jgi:hypothetical protein
MFADGGAAVFVVDQPTENVVHRRLGFGKGTASSRAAIVPKGLTARLKAMPFPRLQRCQSLSPAPYWAVRSNPR